MAEPKRARSNGDTKLINDLDKKVALLAQDLTYVKQGVDDQKRQLTELGNDFRNMKIVTPEALSAYMTAQEKVNQAVDNVQTDHENRIKALEDAATAEKNTYFSRLRAKIGDRAVDIGLTIFYLVVGFVLLQLLTGGGILKNVLTALGGAS